MPPLVLRAAVLAGVLAMSSGCLVEEGDLPVAGPPVPSAAQSPTGPAERLSTAAASDTAGRINLTAADLAGFTAAPPDEQAEGVEAAAEETERIADELTACVGASPVPPVAELASDGFSRGVEPPRLDVSSAVAFVSDADQVRSDLAALTGPRAPECMAAFVRSTVARLLPGVELSPPQVTALRPAATGLDGAFGYSVTTTGTLEDTRTSFAVDLLRATKGRTETTLVLVGTGRNVPTAQRDVLYALLVERTAQYAL